MGKSKYAYQDKVAVVTGGASGIGREICSYIGRAGGRAVVVDCDEDGARSAAEEINADGGSARSMQVDVADSGQVDELIQGTLGEDGRIDYFFNNAGVSVNGEFHDTGSEHWERVMRVNFWGVIHGCRAVYPVMQKPGTGRIRTKIQATTPCVSAYMDAAANHKLYWYLHRLSPSFIPTMFSMIVKRMKAKAR